MRLRRVIILAYSCIISTAILGADPGQKNSRRGRPLCLQGTEEIALGAQPRAQGGQGHTFAQRPRVVLEEDAVFVAAATLLQAKAEEHFGEGSRGAQRGPFLAKAVDAARGPMAAVALAEAPAVVAPPRPDEGNTFVGEAVQRRSYTFHTCQVRVRRLFHLRRRGRRRGSIESVRELDLQNL